MILFFFFLFPFFFSLFSFFFSYSLQRTQINLPRDTGTCTRCPFELRLKSSVEDSTWQCQISLRHEFDEHGDAIEHDEELFGAVIYESRLVELQLRRAQLAILNPSVASKEFHTFDVSQCHENASEYPPLGSQKQHPVSRTGRDYSIVREY